MYMCHSQTTPLTRVCTLFFCLMIIDFYTSQHHDCLLLKFLRNWVDVTALMAEDYAAVCYSQVAGFLNEDNLKLIEQLSPKNGDLVLDLGCGSGYMTNKLMQWVGSDGLVLGVDPDEKRIKLAREDYGGISKNLKFIVGSDLDFPEDQYDLVYASCVIHWIENKEVTFDRIYKNLKPGGRFAFTTQDNPTFPEVVNEIICPFGQETFKATVGSAYWESVQYYRDLAKSVGFEVASMDVKTLSYHYPTVDSLIDTLYGIFQGKFDRSSKLLDDVRKRYEGCKITMINPALNAILIKPLLSSS